MIKLICNSTPEFLIFTGHVGEQSIEARYENETLWLSQKLMAELFGVDVRTVSEHLKNIFPAMILPLKNVYIWKLSGKGLYRQNRIHDRRTTNGHPLNKV